MYSSPQIKNPATDHRIPAVGQSYDVQVNANPWKGAHSAAIYRCVIVGILLNRASVGPSDNYAYVISS